MKKLLRKGVLLFAGTMAVCAFAMPSVASAATWGVVGTEHTLHSPNLGYTSTQPGFGAIATSCSNSTFTIDVRSASTLTVTSAAFRGCTATGAGIGTCTMTWTATPDWTVTGTTTSNIQIHNMIVDVNYENHPGSSSCANFNGLRTTITGNLNGGQWTGNSVNQHEIILNSEEGLVTHGAFGTSLLTLSGTIRDTQQTLTLI